MKPSSFMSPSPSNRRQSSTPHYHTFPTAPPLSRGKPPLSPSHDPSPDGIHHSYSGGSGASEHSNHAPALPRKQLAILAVIALAEQTALNSISPYLPAMAASFPDVQPSQVGLYVGCIGTAFALAQFLTQYFWGWLSDKIGRKPVVLTGTLFTAACFMAFGFCRTLWQAVVVLAAMGLVNGNQGVISTCLGEITDRSNQSKVFVWLPVIYGIGGITGPALGGLLVMERSPFDGGKKAAYPYLLPNLFAAAILLVDLVFTAIFLEESLEEARNLPPLKTRIENLFVWVWQFTGGAIRPTYLRYLGKGQLVHGHHHRVDGSLEYDTDSDISSDIESENQSLLSLPEVFTANRSALSSKHVLNRDTIILLITYLVFQLSNVSFQTLYPVFAFTDPPIGRAISERDIGLSLSAAGVATIIFQVGLFGKLKEKMGNKATYRAGLLLFALSMTAMPFVGYKTGRAPFGWGNPAVWMWGELATILLVRTVASVGGLTSALLLITNSAPTRSTLGTLNGLAQTLSAAGRAIGPIISGGLFSISNDVYPKGQMVVFGTFGGVAFVGFVMSFWIRGEQLESLDGDVEPGSGSEDLDDNDSDEGDEDEDEDEDSDREITNQMM